MADALPDLLYYGANLDILRGYVDDESVDLVHLACPSTTRTTSRRESGAAAARTKC
jgi:hypothetical protein